MNKVLWGVNFMLLMVIVFLSFFALSFKSITKSILGMDYSQEEMRVKVGEVYSNGAWENYGFTFNEGDKIRIGSGKEYFVREIKTYADINQNIAGDYAWFSLPNTDSRMARLAVVYGKPEKLEKSDVIKIAQKSSELGLIVEKISEGDWSTYSEMVSNNNISSNFLLVYADQLDSGKGKYTIYHLAPPN